MNSAPTFEDHLADPSRVRELPTAAARDLFVRLAALQAALTTAILSAQPLIEKRASPADRSSTPPRSAR
jgi:hypothetical protein